MNDARQVFDLAVKLLRQEGVVEYSDDHQRLRFAAEAWRIE